MRRLKGVTVATLTPMNQEGTRVEYEMIKEYAEFLVSRKVDGLFVVGTTGEGLLLDLEERKRVSEEFVKAVDGRAKVVVHCGDLMINNVRKLLEHAKAVGADGAALVSPFYYKCREEELIEFFIEAVRNFDDFPIYLYNIPSLTGNWITPRVVNEVRAVCPNVVGVKDSSGNLLHVLSLINEVEGDFDVVVGCDRAFLTVLQMGAKGCVSGPAAVFPEFFVQLYGQFKDGQIQQARETQKKLTKVSLAIMDGASIPVLKLVLSWRGIHAGGCRLPLRLPDEVEQLQLRDKVSKVLEEVGINF